MRKQRYYLALGEWERNTIIYSINNLRSELIIKGKHTDLADETLIKLINAKKKKFKIV